MDEKNWLIYAPNKGGRADMRLMQASNEPYNHPWEFKHVCVGIIGNTKYKLTHPHQNSKEYTYKNENQNFPHV